MPNIYDDSEGFPEDRQSSYLGGPNVAEIPKACDRLDRKAIYDRLNSWCQQTELPLGSNEILTHVAFSEEIELDVLAQVVEISEDAIEIDWFGGHKLVLSKDCLSGDWGSLKKDDWIEADIVMLENDKVTGAFLRGISKPPRRLNRQQIDDFYQKVPPVKLTPMD